MSGGSAGAGSKAANEALVDRWVQFPYLYWSEDDETAPPLAPDYVYAMIIDWHFCTESKKALFNTKGCRPVDEDLFETEAI